MTNIVVSSQGTAFEKAYNDVASIARGMSYRTLNIMQYVSDDDNDAALISRLDGITAAVSAGDIIVYQYPSFNGARFDKTFIERLKERGVHVALFIHDVFAMFLSPDGSGYHDMELFNLSDLLITHGRKMTQWLRQHGVRTPALSKNLFDYLIDEPEAHVGNELEKRVLVCGNLLKSPFLEDWEFDIPVEAYGRMSIYNHYGVEQFMPLSEKVNYHGSFGQSELLRKIPKSCFGLAWDTDIKDGLFPDTDFYGFYQNYTRYNNPHKVSLYLTLGLPVVVWHEAAVAELVEKYHLGLTIYSLDELSARLNVLTDEDMRNFKNSVNTFSTLLRSGYFTRKALVEVEENFLLQRWKDE